MHTSMLYVPGATFIVPPSIHIPDPTGTSESPSGSPLLAGPPLVVKVAVSQNVDESMSVTVIFDSAGRGSLYCTVAAGTSEVTGASLTGVTLIVIAFGVGSKLMPLLAVPPSSCTWKVKLA